MSLSCFAAGADELPSIEQGALARGFALPDIGESRVLSRAEWHQYFQLGSVNEYEAQTQAGEAIVVDGEVTRLLYGVRRGFGSGWDVGLRIPVLIQGGGYLDGLIQSWHRAFNLPNAGRQFAPSNRYLYQYSRNGQLLLDAHRSSSGVGDLQINVGRTLLGDDLAVRGLLKLPTGDSGTLAGNGAFGGALWLDGRVPNTGRWLFGGGAGLSYTGTGDILPNQQKHLLPFGALEIGYAITVRLSVQSQLYLHAAPYRGSGFSPLAQVAVPVTVSGRYRFSNSATFIAGFQEKGNYGASPDFGIFLGCDFR